MIDMGGASVQIAFEIANEKESYNGGNVYEINLGSIETNEDYKYKIYSTTFLGYGANEGLKKYENSLVKSGNSNDSCSPRGLNRLIGEFTVNVSLETTIFSNLFKFTGYRRMGRLSCTSIIFNR